MELVEKKHCTGCMACVASCSVGAISLEENEFGDKQPVIHSEKCVECGKCRSACPVLADGERRTSQTCYAVWSLNDQVRKTSASGGAASEFYEAALEQGFWICGAEFDGKCQVVHTVSNQKESVGKYRQSKYVYSDFTQAYKTIKQLLNSGEKVLCISLPCKIAGLLTYLGEEYSNLLTVDIVCHGTPSLRLFQDHVETVAKKTEGVSVRFREDNCFMFSVEESNRSLYKKIGRTDMYLAAFLEGLNYREACYQCNFASPARVADMTICDFWGLGAEIPFDHPYSGSISAVLINTEKGNEFFESCRSRFFVEQRPVEEAVKGNAQLNAPTPRHLKRDEYEKLYRQYGFEKAVAMCLKDVIKKEYSGLRKLRCKSALRKFVGVFIKKYRS